MYASTLAQSLLAVSSFALAAAAAATPLRPGGGEGAHYGKPRRGAESPSAQLATGTYVGLYNEEFSQDLFLGIPYAQPPVGDLRFAAPKPLTEKFDEPRSATEYGWMCIGYGSDTSNLGNPVDEDCLTINVVRPAGVKAGDELPVGIWVHGGVSLHISINNSNNVFANMNLRAT